MALRALASNAGFQWGLRAQFGAVTRAFSSGEAASGNGALT
jgi:hypothetical protein